MSYSDFLENKRIKIESCGFEVKEINPKLFSFQSDIVKWALKKGRSAIFADCGCGKTPMQLEWANNVYRHTGGNILILAPLAVSKQTVREGEKFGISVNIARCQEDIKPGINITNYEMLEHFVAKEFTGIVLDESSILKSYDGKTRTHQVLLMKRINYMTTFEEWE
jgi:superfamily II DNA or RNA helicase